MQTDSERLASREHPILLGHKVSIECSGTSVVTMNDDEKAVRRTLEGHGPRWAVREGDGHAPFQLLAGEWKCPCGVCDHVGTSTAAPGSIHESTDADFI